MAASVKEDLKLPCDWHYNRIINERSLIIASNRGPVSIQKNEQGDYRFQKGGGGLVTALSGIASQIDATWIASAQSDAEREWKEGPIPLQGSQETIWTKYLLIDQERYDAYYNVIANPLLWFLQHSMWDNIHSPTIDRTTWQAWYQGYVAVNQQFAAAIAEKITTTEKNSLVFLQDYHLYLAPEDIRRRVGRSKKYSILHFIHIPWPGPEDWGILPPGMRQSILEGLCAVDLLGFQTRQDGLNFIRTCETFLPRSHVNFKSGRIWYRNHATHIRDFPISIDVDNLRELASTNDVMEYRKSFEELVGGCKLIVRVDRTEPSKNITRGFQAFGEMLDIHPEHTGKVMFLALLSPSRLEVMEYQSYLDEIMAAVGRINALYGNSEWEPVRVLVGEDYLRAIAALQLYDVLLVNPVADGMNLVAKEGPVVNLKNGVVVLSERAGARQQMEPGSLIISPCDIYATAEALHQGLTMPDETRRERSKRLVHIVESDDINDWFCSQLMALEEFYL